MKDNPYLRDKLDPPLFSLDEQLSDEELFRKAMEGVKRLEDRPGPLRGRTKEQISKRAKGREEDNSEGELLKAFLSGDGDIEWSYLAEYIEGGAQEWDQLLLKKLRDGGFSVQGELDLHGFNQAQAREKLEEFIRQCTRRQLTCVRIVHGKGKNSRNHIPVLKEKIQHWLSLKRLSRYVVAYTSARPVDGGVGAIYVLLGRGR